MKQKKCLPLMGIGPIYVISIIVITVIAVYLSLKGVLDSGKVEFLKIPLIIVGSLLIIIGINFWIRANFQSKLDYNIKRNVLVTTGVYAYVRNPIYSAFTMICTGILLFMNNFWLLILPIIFWLYMTLLMKVTEEKWLINLYGEEYMNYCNKVNRCIPWFKKSKLI